jgi:hypothetical protein
MALYNLEAIKPPPTLAESLTILSDTFRDETLRPLGRARATSDSTHPEEGLALLKAYVAIDDCKVRQAILDLVVGISERHRPA